MVRMRRQDLNRVRRENARIRNENHILRCSLKNMQRNPYMECRDVLQAVSAFCQEKYRSCLHRGPTGPPFVCPESCHCDTDANENKSSNACEGRGSRVGVGCGGGLCGGYTPSGWNKLKLLGAMADQRDCLPDDTGCHDTGGVARSRPEARGADKSETRSASEGTSGERSCKFRPSVRLLGEMAFQLERRILDYVFGLEGSKKRRFYGYTVSNICYMMEKESTCPDGTSDSVGRSEMTCRLRKILCTLEKYGYDIKVHADFAQEVINKYGLLPCPPDKQTVAAFSLNDACTIACLISRLAKRQSEVHNLNILLNCLNFLSKCDGRPLFVW